jgi:hypothetical protein
LYAFHVSPHEHCHYNLLDIIILRIRWKVETIKFTRIFSLLDYLS